jgi:plastocyanin
MQGLRRLVFAVLAAGLLLPAVAGAEQKTYTYTTGPLTVEPYQVLQNNFDYGIPRPPGAGSIVHMETDLVDKKGAPIPIQRLMLHHIVFFNLGATLGAKKDPTCDSITALDSKSQIPAMVERFYAAGEERAVMRLPQGYGYNVGAEDTWGLTYMVMNHRAVRDTAYIRYTLTYDSDPALTPVHPVWLDVNNCRADPVYDVPGGGAPGTNDVRTADWVAPYGGRLVSGGGHVHGGAKELQLTSPDCQDRLLARSRPTWGNADHPFYNVKPVLHEPGPINMTGFSSSTGVPVAAGERLRLNSIYDAELPHTRVMGIMVVFMTKDESPPAGCAALPADLTETATLSGRLNAPRVTVPLTGLDRNGVAQRISKPKGKLVKAKSVVVDHLAFSKRNLLVSRGTTVRWSFRDDQLHDVTVASGPRGFSSPHQGAGGRFAQKLDTPGTYRLFCSLHPVAMTQRIVVR